LDFVDTSRGIHYIMRRIGFADFARGSRNDCDSASRPCGRCDLYTLSAIEIEYTRSIHRVNSPHSMYFSLVFHLSLLASSAPLSCKTLTSTFVPLLTSALHGRHFKMFSSHGRRGRPNHAPLLLFNKTNFHFPKTLPRRMVLRIRRPLLYPPSRRL
jgi:hypothetical protein